MSHQHALIEETLYFWFASNDTSGSGNDGASALADVREAGAAASAIPVLSPTPALLTHANFPPGCYEVAVAATSGNGFTATKTYSVFCTLTVDSQNPTGFIGSFTLDPIISNLQEIVDGVQSAADLKDFVDSGYDPAVNRSFVDIIAVSGDTGAADNIEATYDGTGYTDDHAPAKQSQLDALANVGSAIHTTAESYTLTTGTQSSGTIADTVSLDGTTHQHTDTGGVLDLYYQFDVGGDGVPVSTQITGRINGSNDTLDGIYAFNWGGSVWDRIGDFIGQASSTNVVRSYDLFTSHVGTGANNGKVRIRFLAASGLTTATLHVDQIFASYSVVNRSVGYEGGAVWIDTNASNTNTESFVDGTADNPVSTLAAATTIATNLGLKVFHLLPNSSITLAQAYDNFEFIGYGFTVALGGQSVSGTLFENGTITGNDDGSNGVATAYTRCIMGSNILGKHVLHGCQLANSITLAETADYFWDACFSGIAGTATPDVDFQSAVETKNLSIRHYSGGIEFKNLGAGSGTHVCTVEGMGQIILNANCVGGTLVTRGLYTLTDNSGGSVLLTEDARLDTIQINTEVLDVLNTDTFAEPGAVPAATATIVEMIHWLFSLARNKATQTATTKTLRNDADSGDIATAAVADAAGTFTRDEFT